MLQRVRTCAAGLIMRLPLYQTPSWAHPEGKNSGSDTDLMSEFFCQVFLFLSCDDLSSLRFASRHKLKMLVSATLSIILRSSTSS
jgi:hypothetical protein